MDPSGLVSPGYDPRDAGRPIWPGGPIPGQIADDHDAPLPGSLAYLNNYYFRWGNSAPADPWWMNSGKEFGDVLAIGSLTLAVPAAAIEGPAYISFGTYTMGEGHLTFSNGIEAFHGLGVPGAMKAYSLGTGYTPWLTVPLTLRNPDAVLKAVEAGNTYYNCLTTACKCLWQGL